MFGHAASQGDYLAVSNVQPNKAPVVCVAIGKVSGAPRSLLAKEQMYLQLLAALLVNMVVGGLWYSPWMFGDEFIKTSKLKKEELSMGPGQVIGTIIFALMEICGLYYVITFVRCASILEAIKFGYFCWQFFVCPTIGVHFLYDQRSLKELLSKWGHHFTSFVLEAAVIQLLAH